MDGDAVMTSLFLPPIFFCPKSKDLWILCCFLAFSRFSEFFSLRILRSGLGMCGEKERKEMAEIPFSFLSGGNDGP